ncbi:chymotrypsin-2-like [Neocloeon triangulifer]|uniref:chymotrypsin-2-like n=1 Tax=Neocloeon triangulifer TaxID=2078957 RepID=UPI00286F9F35|nr:chymotrypsin-2-like [Neocloeon triangulifer]
MSQRILISAIISLVFSGGVYCSHEGKGVGAASGEIPWHVSIRFDGKAFCSAAIVSREWILTRAQCLLTYNTSADRLDVNAGSIRYDQINSLHLAVDKQDHPGYNYDGGNGTHDIGLLKVSPPFEWSNLIAPIALPDSNLPTGQAVSFSGWNSYLLYPNYAWLVRVDGVIIDPVECQNSFPYPLHELAICADAPEIGQSFECPHDTGGPLFADRVLYGVNTWKNGCDLAEPSVFISVFDHIDWIRNVTGV